MILQLTMETQRIYNINEDEKSLYFTTLNMKINITCLITFFQ